MPRRQQNPRCSTYTTCSFWPFSNIAKVRDCPIQPSPNRLQKIHGDFSKHHNTRHAKRYPIIRDARNGSLRSVRDERFRIAPPSAIPHTTFSLLPFMFHGLRKQGRRTFSASSSILHTVISVIRLHHQLTIFLRTTPIRFRIFMRSSQVCVQPYTKDSSAYGYVGGPAQTSPPTFIRTAETTSANFHFNGFWLGLFSLRKMQAQHSVPIFSLHPAFVYRFR